MTAADRLLHLAERTGTAAALLLAIGSGTAAGQALAQYSGLPAGSAATHLLHERADTPVPPPTFYGAGGGGHVADALRRPRPRRVREAEWLWRGFP